MFDLGSLIDLMIVLLIVAVFALIFGVLNFFMYRTITETQRREKAVQTWPTVTGTIGTSEARTHRHSGRQSATFPHVTYTYEVNGKTHHSSNIMAGGEIGGLNVESTLARYPQGSKVTVYYDPQNPKDAVLEPTKTTVSKAIWLMLAAMNIIVCVGGVWAVYGTLKK